MKFDIDVTHVIFSPDATDEQKRDAMRAFAEHLKGMKQHEAGKARQQFADAFMGLLHPESVKRLEQQIAGLQTVKSPDKFRAEVIMLMGDAFQSGLAWGIDMKKEAIDKGVNVLDLIGLGDKYQVRTVEPGAAPAKPTEPTIINPPSDKKS